MATKKELGNLRQPERVTEKLKHLTCSDSNQNHLTTLDVEQMCVSTNELTNAMSWLEKVALSKSRTASHALALCWFIEASASALDRVSTNE